MGTGVRQCQNDHRAARPAHAPLRHSRNRQRVLPFQTASTSAQRLIKIGRRSLVKFRCLLTVLADQGGWERYEAAKWLTMRRWLEANPDDEFANAVRAKLTTEPERYAAYTREYLGWGVFALMTR